LDPILEEADDEPPAEPDDDDMGVEEEDPPLTPLEWLTILAFSIVNAGALHSCTGGPEGYKAFGLSTCLNPGCFFLDLLSGIINLSKDLLTSKNRGFESLKWNLLLCFLDLLFSGSSPVGGIF
jgi:hypothetical protein